jgi:hypothetical protein
MHHLSVADTRNRPDFADYVFEVDIPESRLHLLMQDPVHTTIYCYEDDYHLDPRTDRLKKVPDQLRRYEVHKRIIPQRQNDRRVPPQVLQGSSGPIIQIKSYVPITEIHFCHPTTDRLPEIDPEMLPQYELHERIVSHPCKFWGGTTPQNVQGSFGPFIQITSCVPITQIQYCKPFAQFPDTVRFQQNQYPVPPTQNQPTGPFTKNRSFVPSTQTGPEIVVSFSSGNICYI